MLKIWLYAISSVIIVSLSSLIGIFTFSLKENRLKSILIYMISFSAGGLFGDAFIHLLPEAAKKNGFSISISLYLLLGIATAFILEKFICWRHCHHPTTEEHPHPLAYMNIFGDVVHNFIDGLIIGAAYMVNISVGIATTIAVVFHEIPQEIGDFGILLHSGFSKKKALFVNFLTALTAILGTVLALIISTKIESFVNFLIPFAAGSFIYIAGSDLIPELHKEVKISKSLLQFFYFLLGILVMMGLLVFD